VKSVSVQTAATLEGNVHLGARLFALFTETPIYVTDAAMDISFDAGDGLGACLYKSARALVDGEDVAAVRRGRSKLALSVAPDDVEVSLALGAMPNGQSIRLAAVRGQFDGRRVRILRLFSTWFAGDASTGPVTDVDGLGFVADASSAELRLVVKARTDLLARPLPPRVIAPACQWQLYGAGCEVDPTTHTESLTVASGSTVSLVVSTVASAKVNPGALLYFTSGANVGVQRNVRISAGVNLYPIVRLPFTPAPGDTFKIIRGCDRTRATCDRTFANLPRFGGYPDIPDRAPKVKV
jgi:uncharacterized phage protein (TIGR02218 family)